MLIHQDLQVQSYDSDTKRPALEALLDFVREGDTIVVHSMDRLARNLVDLRCLVRKVSIMT